jgi:hypothetical protein
VKLAAYCLDVALIVGYPHREGRTRYNAAAVLRGGRMERFYCKQRLPNYKVFDEKRYFRGGQYAMRLRAGRPQGRAHHLRGPVVPEPAAQAQKAGAELLLSINASPFHRAQQAERYQRMGARVKETKLPLLYVHGRRRPGRDRVRRSVVRALRRRHAGLPGRDLPRVHRHRRMGRRQAHRYEAKPLTEEETIYRALITGTADYVDKNGFPGVLLGLVRRHRFGARARRYASTRWEPDRVPRRDDAFAGSRRP